MLGIRLFGYLEAVKGKEPPIRKFRSRSAGEVLAYLSVAMPRAVSREEVAATIWPEDEPDQARSSLRTALYSLRKQLGLPDDPAGPLGGDRSYVWLNPDKVETDLLSFQAHVDRAQAAGDRKARFDEFQIALSMVRGPLLEGLEATWTVPHQLAFEETYCNTVTSLIEVLTSDGSASVAVEIGREALKIVPLREDVHVALIRSLGAAGRMSEALRQFEVLEQLLLDHWGEYPSEHAVAAIEELGQSPQRPGKPKRSRESIGFETSRGWVLGRDEEVNSFLVEVQSADGARLITILGTGGSGKTTVAHAVAEKLVEVMPVCFVDMSAAREVRTVTSLVARALDLGDPNSPDAVDRIGTCLAQREGLIVLDNAEHLLPALAGVIKCWIRPQQASRIVVTSRVPLGLEGEKQQHLAPFPLPDRTDTLGALTANPAVGLFVLKAKAADPDFELTSQNAAAIAEICAVLDGLPLAITLAASHVALMTPAQILKKLQDHRFEIAAVGIPQTGRHSSLDRAVRWSYDLLSEDARLLFSQMGICRGDFSVDLAEAVHGVDVQASLLELVRSSLLERTVEGEIVRFRMLIPLRQFALDRLRESGQEEETRARHRDYCHDLAESLRWEFQGPGAAEAFEAAEHKHDHFRQLSDYAISSRVGLGQALRCAFFLGSFFAMRRYSFEWVDRIGKMIQAAADAGNVSEYDLACGYAVLAQLNIYLTFQREARSWLTKALPVFEAHGNPVNIAGVLNLLAMTHFMPSDTHEMDVETALNILGRSSALLETAVASGEWSAVHLRVATLSNTAAAYRMVDRNEEAITVLTDALQQAQRHGLRRLLPVLLLGIADNHQDIAHFESAITFADEAIRAAENSGVIIYSTSARLTKAWCLLCLGRFVEAAELLYAHSCFSSRSSRVECGVATFIIAVCLAHLDHEELAREGHTVCQRCGFRHGVTWRTYQQSMIPDFMLAQTIHAADLDPDSPTVIDYLERAKAILLPSKS